MLKKVLSTLVASALLAITVLFILIFTAAPDRKGIDSEIYADGKGRPAEEVVKQAINKARKPNIIVILADDLGYGDLGVQGSNVLKTPNIDLMAKSGMRFTNYYASSSVCSPSRASLLTGRYPPRTGITNALQPTDGTLIRDAVYQFGVALSYLSSADLLGGSSAVKGLPESEITIPEALQQGGYRTMGIGKWHLGDFTEFPEYHPLNQGFDEFVGFNMSNDDFPVAFWRGNEEIVEDIGADQERYTKLFTDEAINFIERNQDKPFFIYLAHKDVHLPFFPSKDFAGTSEGGPYGDAVSEFDWSTGEVLKSLDRLGLGENTLVILTSDNGPWYEGDPGHLRGRKGQSYEGGFRVPFIVKWPKTVPENTVIDDPAMAIDLFPTFMQLAGIELPSDRIIDGSDLTPILTGQQKALPERPLYFFHDFDVEAVRIGDWKYYDSYSRYVWPVPVDKPDTLTGKVASARDYTPEGTDIKIPVGPELPTLYHVGVDFSESYSVNKRYPIQLKKMQANYFAWRSRFYDNPRGWKR